MTPSIYGATGGIRSSNSNSPGNAQSSLLVVPQPINATKMNSGMANGTGRKYQCKMCPQVNRFVSNFWKILMCVLDVLSVFWKLFFFYRNILFDFDFIDEKIPK